MQTPVCGPIAVSPLDRHAVGGVLAVQPEPSWRVSRAHLAQADQADAGNRGATDQLRPERVGNDAAITSESTRWFASSQRLI